MSDILAIIDYGSGNLRSAAKSFEKIIADEGLDMQVIVTPHAEDIAKASHIVLPGQGAYGDCMGGLRAVDGMVEALEDSVLKRGAPFLGICVGMQLLTDKGYEHGEHEGLGWIAGEVHKMQPYDPTLKIPHMGWNEVEWTQADNSFLKHRKARSAAKGRLQAQPGGSPPEAPPAFEGRMGAQRTDDNIMMPRSTDSKNHYYFVHSFHAKMKERKHVLATTDYGGEVTAIIGRDNIIGTQFHPEKSQKAGLELLTDFVMWKP